MHAKRPIYAYKQTYNCAYAVSAYVHQYNLDVCMNMLTDLSLDALAMTQDTDQPSSQSRVGGDAPAALHIKVPHLPHYRQRVELILRRALHATRISIWPLGEKRGSAVKGVAKGVAMGVARGVAKGVAVGVARGVARGVVKSVAKGAFKSDELLSETSRRLGKEC